MMSESKTKLQTSLPGAAGSLAVNRNQFLRLARVVAVNPNQFLRSARVAAVNPNQFLRSALVVAVNPNQFLGAMEQVSILGSRSRTPIHHAPDSSAEPREPNLKNLYPSLLLLYFSLPYRFASRPIPFLAPSCLKSGPVPSLSESARLPDPGHSTPAWKQTNSYVQPAKTPDL
jgi:hypothetical protein